MPALNFPNNPSLNQIYTANDTTWKWNGSSWIRANTGTQGVQGIPGDSFWRTGPTGISTSSNVGIGTTTSSSLYTLDVSGDVKVGIDTSKGVILTSPSGTKYRLFVDDSGNLDTTTV